MLSRLKPTRKTLCPLEFVWGHFRLSRGWLSAFIALQFTVLALAPALSCARADGAGLWLLRVFLMTLSHSRSTASVRQSDDAPSPLRSVLSAQEQTLICLDSRRSDRWPGKLDVHNTSPDLAFGGKITLRDWAIKGNILAVNVLHCYERCLINGFSILARCRAVNSC